jgi:hypothetical protein
MSLLGSISENFLADNQAVTTLSKKILGILNHVPPYLHHRFGKMDEHTALSLQRAVRIEGMC